MQVLHVLCCHDNCVTVILRPILYWTKVGVIYSTYTPKLPLQVSPSLRTVKPS